MKICNILIRHSKKRSNFWAIVDCSGNDYGYKRYVYVWGRVGHASRHLVKLSDLLYNRKLRRAKYNHNYDDLSPSNSTYNTIVDDIGKYITIKTLEGKIKSK